MNYPAEIYDLLARYLTGEASAEEEARVQEWLDSEPANQQLLDEMRQIMAHSSEALDVPEANVNTDAAWGKLQAKMKGESTAKEVALPETKVRHIGRWAWAAAAAAIVGVLFVISLLLPGDAEALMVTTETGNEVISDTLPDGSIVTLNINSSIEYPKEFTIEQRNIKLTGEAFFEVSHDPAKPFVISAGNSTVTVLGTSFNVSAYEEQEEISVTVETGKVAFAIPELGEEVLLEASERGSFDKRNHSLTESLNKNPSYQLWRGKLVFSNTPLVEVIDLLNEYYNSNLSLENPAAGKCRFTGSFSDDSLETVLDVIMLSFDLQMGENGLLKGKACDSTEQ